MSAKPILEKDITEFIDLIKAHKTQPVSGIYLASRMNITSRRILNIADCCKRMKIPLLTTAMNEGSGKSGYTMGCGDIVLLSQIKIGDFIEIWDSHFEDSEEYAKYWKKFEVIGETNDFYVLKTACGVRTTLLKRDMYDGHIRVLEV